MAKLQIKKSNETGKVPQPSDLDWGELALNYADGKLFYKKNGTNTVELLTSVTRLRGTTGGAYTSGDLTLLAGTNITVTQSGSEYTIASAGGADSTKLPLAGGTLTGQLTINAVGAASSPTLRLNTSSSSAFVHTQESLAENLTTGQHAISVIGKASNTKNSGYIGYYWADNASDNNFVTIGHWGNDDLFRVYGNGNVTVGTNAILHAGNYNSYALPLTGGTLTGALSVSLDASIYGITVGRGGGAVASNTAVGAGALAANTTGAYNVAFGQSSLAANTTGNFNTAIAREALASNTTGVHNTSVGHDNLYGNTSGSYNTALGSWALQSNTTASYNTAVGYQSGYSQTTGGNNTSFGATSLYTTTTGTLNTAIGQSSLYSNTTGGSNTALGLQALFSNTTASNNTAVGYQAGYTNTTSSYNTIFGAQAGYLFTNASDGFNTFLGRQSGYNTTGTKNTFVGDGSAYLVTTGSKNTVVGMFTGNQGGLDIRTASNYIVLSDGDGNPRIVVNGSGNTGVGNPAPTEKLDVAGNIKHTGLTMTAGTNVDQIYTHQQNITLTTGWQDTGVNAAELATGSYIVQVTNVQDSAVGGQQYEEYYTGIMSWFAGNTNSNMSDEIALHRAGHAPNDGTIFLRVLRTYGADTDDLKLQIAGTTNNTAAYQYTFKFRRLI